jgi:hypothetical protein
VSLNRRDDVRNGPVARGRKRIGNDLVDGLIRGWCQARLTATAVRLAPLQGGRVALRRAKPADKHVHLSLGQAELRRGSQRQQDVRTG